ncbi:MAG: hypothetical protein HRT37_25645 [Alteromonadaceae bacterium]|nr:hypothetical protein [Alteromonadaceae bacterium]
MHNTHQFFAARQRLINFDGDASNQLIWFADLGVNKYINPTMQALEVLDHWINNIKMNPGKTVGQNKPVNAVDACWNSDNTIRHRGEDVWDGILNDKPDGACTQDYKIYSNSRMVAGAPITGDVFKCELQSIDDAITKGVYGNWHP